MNFMFGSLLENLIDPARPRASKVWNHVAGYGIAYQWDHEGRTEKAEIYGNDVPRLQAAFATAARDGKREWDLVEAVTAAQKDNITGIALSNGKNFNDGPKGEPALRFYYPGSETPFLTEYWNNGTQVSSMRTDEPKPALKPRLTVVPTPLPHVPAFTG